MRSIQPQEALPSVDLILKIDQHYRDQSEQETLLRIAPKRFNPKQEAWLPMMRLEKDKWQFTVLFSNTALAHYLNRIRDWVVIYFASTDSSHEGQCTVVTETKGELAGKRLIRGREKECLEYYQTRQKPAA